MEIFRGGFIPLFEQRRVVAQHYMVVFELHFFYDFSYKNMQNFENFATFSNIVYNLGNIVNNILFALVYFSGLKP